MEEWRLVPSFPALEASSEGRVRRVGREPLKTRLSCHGYPLLVTRFRGGQRKTIAVHRLVCEAFHGPANGRQVDHLNAVRSDNRAANLEWVTAVENTVRAKSTKLSAADVAEIRASGETGLSLAARFGVTPSNISKIRHGVSWDPSGRAITSARARKCRAALASVMAKGDDVRRAVAA